MASRPAIYGHLALSRIRAQLQYPVSFAFHLLGSFLFSLLDFLTILVIFLHVKALGDWSIHEVAFLYGTSYVTFRVVDILMTNLDRLPTLVRLGTFDQILTRPLGSLGQVMTGDMEVRHVGSVIQGAAVWWYAFVNVHIDWTIARVVVLCFMLIGGIVIFSAVWVATNAIAFWTTDAREVANAFTYGGNMLTQFPLNIFGAWLRRMLAFAVPLAFVNYLPSLYILDKRDPDGLPASLAFASPVVAALAAGAAALIWRAAVRHYRSTGS